MFEIRKDSFYLNGKKFRLFSGAMHYFRVPREYWDDRIAKMKACGFNCVETVAPWNFHEMKRGEFDFSGMRDIAAYCRTAAKYGLYVIIRPGPYICAEWDFGGFPARLLADKNLRIRCDDPAYLAEAEIYIAALMKEIAPLQVTCGGNLLALQIENEYGSYGNDKDYLRAVEKMLRDNGAEVPFFTSDGTASAMLSGGTLPHIYKTLNFGSHAETAFGCLKGIQDDMPKTCMEFWCGWFDHWGEIHHRRDPRQVAREVKKLVESGANINIYTFHGGTNFGCFAGANYDVRYKPTVTSYDDAALLNEFGDYTPAYHRVRKVLRTAQGLSLDEPLPLRPELQSVGEVTFKESADLWQTVRCLGDEHKSAAPECMEKFGLDHGYILYSTKIEGKYGAMKLSVEGVHDVAYVRLDGKLVKTYSRTSNRNKKRADGFVCSLPPIEGSATLEILVESMGRINYGSETENDRKGIQKAKLGWQTLFGWRICTLAADKLAEADFKQSVESGSPAIYRGTFNAQKGKDCFVDMRGFNKGYVFVNGFNLGRYWRKGPQRTLYLPAPLLKEKDNEIVVAEQECTRRGGVKIIGRHLL